MRNYVCDDHVDVPVMPGLPARGYSNLPEISDQISLLKTKLRGRLKEVNEELLAIKKRKKKGEMIGPLVSLVALAISFIVVVLTKLVVKEAAAVSIAGGAVYSLLSALQMVLQWVAKTVNEKEDKVAQEKNLLEMMEDGCSSMTTLSSLWEIRVTAENLKLLRADLRHGSVGTAEDLKAAWRDEMTKLAKMIENEEEKVKRLANLIMAILKN